MLCGSNSFVASGVSNIVNKLYQSSHALTWFSSDGLEDFVVSKQGSKPGDPLGDLAFAFLICRVLRYTHGKLASAGLGCNLSVDGCY